MKCIDCAFKDTRNCIFSLFSEVTAAKIKLENGVFYGCNKGSDNRKAPYPERAKT